MSPVGTSCRQGVRRPKNGWQQQGQHKIEGCGRVARACYKAKPQWLEPQDEVLSLQKAKPLGKGSLEVLNMMPVFAGKGSIVIITITITADVDLRMATLGLNVCHRGDDQQIDKIGSGDRRGRCHCPGMPVISMAASP